MLPPAAPAKDGHSSSPISVCDPGSYLPKTNNGGVSTMFPKSWTADRIKVEVDAAFQNRTVTGNKWNGTTPSGVRVEGYLSSKATVYPKL
ncbi:EndoU domain-containing protein [Pseudomonas aeruginosa]|uniref:EndoU domain-containing protein n=1 Tax=Pseudomonas aeruginosa TaxID=287 RepID=UPI0031B6BE10